MPIYRVADPSGKVYRIEGPEGATDEQLISVLRGHLAASDKQVGFWGAAKEAALTLPRKGLEAAEFAFDTSPETREALIKAGTPEGQYTNFSDIHDVGSFTDWAKQTLGSTAGYLAAPAAAAGAVGLLPEALVGASAAGLAGAVGTGTLGAQYVVDNLSRQAETQQAAIERGEAPEETSLGAATVAAAGQTILDVAGFKFFAPVFKAFPVVGKLLGTEGEEISQKTVKDLVEGYRANKFTVKNGIVKGVVHGVAFEIPQELAQQALERWQAGLSLTDKDAQDEFIATAAGAALGGSVLGPVTGVSKNLQSRKMAEQILADYEAKTRGGEADVSDRGAERVEQSETGAGGVGVQAPVQPGATEERAAEESVSGPMGGVSPAPKRIDVGAPQPQGKLDLKYQRGERLDETPWYYSALYNTAVEARTNKAPAKEWLSILRKPGIKEDEIRATGVEDWLNAQTGPVSKADLVDFLDDNRVIMQEITNEPGRSLGEENPGVHYGDWTQPGPKENYKEFILTLKNKSPDKPMGLPPDWRVVPSDLGDTWELHDADGRVHLDYMPEYVTTSREAEEFATEWYYEQGWGKGEIYRSHNFPQIENPLLHVRTTDRTDANGNKILYVEEVQSDWGQEAAKSKRDEKLKAEMMQIRGRLFELQDIGEKLNIAGMEMSAELLDEYYSLRTRYFELDNKLSDESQELNPLEPPPHHADTAAWTTLGLKKILTHAARNGYDTVTFPTGEQVYKVVHGKEEGQKKYYNEILPSNLKKLVSKLGGKVASTDVKLPEGVPARYIANNYKFEETPVFTSPEAEQNIDGLIHAISRALVDRERRSIKRYESMSVADAYRYAYIDVRENILDSLSTGWSDANGWSNMVASYANYLPRELRSRATNYILENLKFNFNIYDRATGELATPITFDTKKAAYRWIEDNYNLTPRTQMSVTITPEMREQLLKGLPLFRRGAKGEKVLSVGAAQRVVKDLTKGWRNAPTIRVYDSVASLPARFKDVFPDTRGFYDPQTKTVYVIADNAASEASLKGTVFHESLGHYGLKEQFGAALNNVLGDIYKTNPAMRKAADTWLKLNPDTYAGLSESQQHINAIEEVLAERSEAGPLKGTVQTVFGQIARVIRQFLRKMGLVKTYSDADVREILRQAHGAVISSPEGLPAQQHEAKLMYQRGMGVFDQRPKFDNTLIDKFLNKLSAMPSPVQEQFFRMSSLNQIRDMAESINPKYGIIVERINQSIGHRDNDLNNGRITIERNLHKWSRTIAKFAPALREKFYAVANDTTVYQIDVLDQATQDLLKKPYASLSQEDQQAVGLVREYNALDPKLRKVYAEMRKAYEDEGKRFFDMMAKVVDKSVYKKITDAYNSKRLKVYLPLIRSGDYWLTYQDQNNDTQTLAYDSPRERDLAAKEVEKKLGVKTEKFSRLDIRGISDSAPPTGFLADVVKQMKTGGVNKAIIDSVYESFLNYLPTTSARQMFRKRSMEPPRGFVQNPIQAYATAASRLNSHITNSEYATVLGNHLNDLIKQMGGLKTSDQINSGLYKSIVEQVETALNPSYSTMDQIGSGVYYWTMAGNVSTALMNVFTLPMVVGPVLAGKYGDVKAMKAMTDAFGTIFKGGFDDNTEFLPDITFGKNARGELAQLYKELVSRAVIRRSTGYDIKEAQKVDIDDYNGTWTKVKRLLGYGMHNMERFTREATAIAAFNLARQGGKNVKTAINEAVRVVEDTHGTAIAEAGPAMAKSGIGRMAYMLKRFPHTMLWLQAKLFKRAFSDQDPKTRSIARRQLLRMYGSALAFAGIQGLPLMGAVNVFASMLNGLFGDDDEPYDVEEELRDIFGTTLYTGLMNDVLGLDFASRTSLSDLIWRDDPRRLAQIGPVAYVTEKFLGPSASLAMNVQRGVGLMNEGHVERGLEAILPAAFRNMLKSFRYAEEGAKTLDGKPIVAPENVGARDLFAQFLGISPTAITEANVKASAQKEAQTFINARKTALYNRLYAAFMAHDKEGWNETLQDMAEFSRKHPGWAFTPQAIMQSIKTNMQHQRDSVFGVYTPAKQRAEIVADYAD